MSNLTYGQAFAARAIGFTGALTEVVGIGGFLFGVTAALSSDEFYSQTSSTYNFMTTIGTAIGGTLALGSFGIGALGIPVTFIVPPVGMSMMLGGFIAGTVLTVATATNYIVNGMIVPYVADEIHQSTHPENTEINIIGDNEMVHILPYPYPIEI